jgi:hypothetical protein
VRSAKAIAVEPTPKAKALSTPAVGVCESVRTMIVAGQRVVLDDDAVADAGLVRPAGAVQPDAVLLAGLDHLGGELHRGREPLAFLTKSGTVSWSISTKWSSNAATCSGRSMGASPHSSRTAP